MATHQPADPRISPVARTINDVPDAGGLFEEPIDPSLDAVPLVFEEPAHSTLRVRHGVAGAMLAGALLAFRDLLETPKDPAPVTVESSGEPGDVDADGISLSIGGAVRVVAPALPFIPPTTHRPGRGRAGRSSRARERG